MISRVHYEHAAANLNRRYSKSAKAFLYNCTTRNFEHIAKCLHERIKCRVAFIFNNSFATRVSIFCWQYLMTFETVKCLMYHILNKTKSLFDGVFTFCSRIVTKWWSFAWILMLVQCTHPLGSCTWHMKISACVHYFVIIYLQKM